MAYKDFTLEDIELQFGIKNRTASLFAEESIKALTPSTELINDLAEARELPVRSEKAKSELIVVPILLELRKSTNNHYSRSASWSSAGARLSWCFLTNA